MWRKNSQLVEDFLSCGNSIPMQDKLLNIYNEKVFLMNNRPLAFCHGDFHLGNMVIQNDKIGISDVVNCSLADPYEEFKRGYWSVVESELFQTGMLNGYFNNNIPEEFFEILQLYSIESMMTRLLKAINKATFELISKLNDLQIQWWGNFDYKRPTWYKGIIFEKYFRCINCIVIALNLIKIC